ncbi:unnamed protein product [Ilex paraguariensis]|uniref:RNase H type-1 domain-containing protein n=1 Tax=Ilex paraguariensis TaxID=185542 RepID=A0ABC8RHV3_9AQUA
MRNETIFQYLPPGPKEAIHRAQLNWGEQSLIHSKKQSNIRTPVQQDRYLAQQWHLPPLSLIKFTFKLSSKLASIGVIGRDSNDVLREGISKLVPVVSAIYSEVAAVRGACLVVVTLQCFHTTIESDYQSLILLCTREDGPPWEIANFVEDIIAIA